MTAKHRILSCGLLLVSVQILSGQSHGQTAAVAPAAQRPAFTVPVSPKLRMPAEVDEAEAAGQGPSAGVPIPFLSTLSPEDLADKWGETR